MPPIAAFAAVVGTAVAGGTVVAGVSMAAVVAGAVSGAIYGAVIGGVMSAISGNNILEGALKGGLMGAAAGAVGGALFGFSGGDLNVNGVLNGGAEFGAGTGQYSSAAEKANELALAEQAVVDGQQLSVNQADLIMQSDSTTAAGKAVAEDTLNKAGSQSFLSDGSVPVEGSGLGTPIKEAPKGLLERGMEFGKGVAGKTVEQLPAMGLQTAVAMDQAEGAEKQQKEDLAAREAQAEADRLAGVRVDTVSTSPLRKTLTPKPGATLTQVAPASFGVMNPDTGSRTLSPGDQVTNSYTILQPA